MITLKKYITSSLFFTVLVLYANISRGQKTKLFITGNHEYKKYSSSNVYYGDKLINSVMLDSFHLNEIDIPVYLKIKIGNDTLYSDTFSIRLYYNITEIITGYTSSIKNIRQQMKKDEDLFTRRTDESQLMYVLNHYKILNNHNNNSKRIKYYFIKFYNTVLIKSSYKYCNKW